MTEQTEQTEQTELDRKRAELSAAWHEQVAVEKRVRQLTRELEEIAPLPSGENAEENLMAHVLALVLAQRIRGLSRVLDMPFMMRDMDWQRWAAEAELLCVMLARDEIHEHEAYRVRRLVAHVLTVRENPAALKEALSMAAEEVSELSRKYPSPFETRQWKPHTIEGAAEIEAYDALIERMNEAERRLHAAP